MLLNLQESWGKLSVRLSVEGDDFCFEELGVSKKKKFEKSGFHLSDYFSNFFKAFFDQLDY